MCWIFDDFTNYFFNAHFSETTKILNGDSFGNVLFSWLLLLCVVDVVAAAVSVASCSDLCVCVFFSSAWIFFPLVVFFPYRLSVNFSFRLSHVVRLLIWFILWRVGKCRKS